MFSTRSRVRHERSGHYPVVIVAGVADPVKILESVEHHEGAFDARPVVEHLSVHGALTCEYRGVRAEVETADILSAQPL